MKNTSVNQVNLSVFQNLLWALALIFAVASCTPGDTSDSSKAAVDSTSTDDSDENFEYMTEQFADVKILRYRIPAWDMLSLNEKKLVYYLVEAGLSGRDIMYDQNYKHNLLIRNTLENIYKNYEGERSGADWDSFVLYLKRIWFSNGIHHHYSYDKFEPGFSREYLTELLDATGSTLGEEVMNAIFDPTVDAKKVSKEAGADLVASSAVNFYGEGVTQNDVENFYAKMRNPDDERPVAYGLNSKLVKNASGQLEEVVYKIDGLYGPAIERIVYWLEKARDVTENQAQADALDLLIEYYKTGDLKTWDEYNVAWVQDTTGTVDYINGFIEVYNDPMGYRGSYETIVEIKDLEASEQMRVLADHAQYFESNSPIDDEYKKENVVGISYNFINVAGEAGDASPTTPIGVNLPNSDWIRKEYGSKSVSLGNIVEAYDKAGTKGFLEEFGNDSAEVERARLYSAQAGKLHTALHEVIGHASGKLAPGVASPKEALKNYASTLEEARADLVALYYIMDPKLVEFGVMDDLDVGRTSYDGYIKNGLMLQLRRLSKGANIEQDHMRNRQMVAAWVFEKGEADSVIVKEVRDGKTYFDIRDYDALRDLFGELLKEVQRIKSEGDFEAGRDLVETYGVIVDGDIYDEVIERTERFKSAPYGGFINPRLVAVEENGEIVDVRVEYPDDFTEQMLEYGEKYSNLPVK